MDLGEKDFLGEKIFDEKIFSSIGVYCCLKVALAEILALLFIIENDIKI